MKTLIALLLSLVVSVSLTADPAAHRQMASELVSVVSGAELLKTGFNASLEPMFQNMRQRGAPADMIKEYHEAMDAWFSTEIKWSELEPLMVDLYVQEFTENELTAIVAFIKTPVGQKMMKNTPVMTQKGMLIGQQYAKTKQASLEAKLKEINVRYQAKAAAAAAAAATPAPAPAPAATIK